MPRKPVQGDRSCPVCGRGVRGLLGFNIHLGRFAQMGDAGHVAYAESLLNGGSLRRTHDPQA